MKFFSVVSLFLILADCASQRCVVVTTPREKPSYGHAVAGTIGAILVTVGGVASVLSGDIPGALNSILTAPMVVDDLERVRNKKRLVPVEELEKRRRTNSFMSYPR